MWIIFPWHSFLVLSHFSFSQRASSTDKPALWVSLLSWEQKHPHIIADVFVWILFSSNFHAERKYWGVFLFYRPSFHPRGVFQDVHVGNLKVNSKYRVSVGAYGWAGEGRPSVPRDVSTASHGKSMWVERRFFQWAGSLIVASVLSFHSLRLLSAISDQCMPPSPPMQPAVMAVSDTELALSWQQGESEGSAPVLHFLVAYIRSVLVSWPAARWFYCSILLRNPCRVCHYCLPCQNSARWYFVLLKAATTPATRSNFIEP